MEQLKLLAVSGLTAASSRQKLGKEATGSQNLAAVAQAWSASGSVRRKTEVSPASSAPRLGVEDIIFPVTNFVGRKGGLGRVNSNATRRSRVTSATPLTLTLLPPKQLAVGLSLSLKLAVGSTFAGGPSRICVSRRFRQAFLVRAAKRSTFRAAGRWSATSSTKAAGRLCRTSRRSQAAGRLALI